MTPEAQRIAIAEACGLLTRVAGEVVEFRRWDTQSNGVFERVAFPDGSVRPCYRCNLPDYLNDLNAMHEAEKMLKSETPLGKSQSTFSEYIAWLRDIVNRDWKITQDVRWMGSATAAQRAEAFLRTLNLWTE